MTRVLFVDDEPQVLDELRQMLRGYRQEWSMEFCEGPEQALATMADEPFDVVVADMQMPVMDGAKLLSRVRELYPETVRIVLSGQSDEESVLRSVGNAHQYLSKPCNPEFLRQAVTRARLLGKRMTNPDLKSLVTRLDSLPSLPDIYLKLSEELRKENCGVDSVGELISKDVSMTAKILQLVNSSFFALPVHISDAKHAAALLGLNTLKPLVLTASIFRQLEQSRVSASFLEAIFSQSLTVGGLAKKLCQAEDCTREDQDNAFLAGVLHAIGRVIFADNFGREYTVLCQQSAPEDGSLASHEIEQYGAAYYDVGCYLLGLWGLPQDILEAVTYHLDPTASVDTSFTPLSAVHVAHALTRTVTGSEPDANWINPDYLVQLGLEDRVETWQEIANEFASLV